MSAPLIWSIIRSNAASAHALLIPVSVAAESGVLGVAAGLPSLPVPHAVRLATSSAAAAIVRACMVPPGVANHSTSCTLR